MILKFPKIKELMIWKMQKKKKNWMEETTQKTTKSEAKELYNKLIRKDIDTLEREKIDEPDTKDMMTLENLISWIFSIM